MAVVLVAGAFLVPLVVPAGPAASAAAGTADGSSAVGSSRYAYPANAVFVSVSGSDSASGRLGSPLRTLARAVSVVRAGGTIVLRGGSYHQSVTTPQGKSLTIQSFPGEAVWLDGSSTVSGWVRSGAGWVHNGWTTKFDASPTYTRGAPMNTATGWQTINAAYPMAAHPDQVWVGGARLQQVSSVSELDGGSFFVDYATDQLFIGSDPAGREVRASTLVTAMTVMGPNVTVRGIGVRRYAPSVPDMGTVRFTQAAKGGVLENVVSTENATTGLSIGSTGTVLHKVTASDNGFLGIHSVYADGLKASDLLVRNNNTERFNPAPSAGGFKITRSRQVSVTSSSFISNYGTGVWFDESVYGINLVGNDMIGNKRAGTAVELSSHANVVNNLLRDNEYVGILIQDTDTVQVWNNVVEGSPLTVWIAQDSRDALNLSTAGHDPRQALPDPSMPWKIRNVTIRNNVLADPLNNGDNWCGLLCLQDQTKQQTAAQMGVTADGNVYHRTTSTVPSQSVRWAAGGVGMTNFPTLAAFRNATGQEANGWEGFGSSILAANGELRAAVVPSSVGVSIPSAISRLSSGSIAGDRTVGVIR